MKRTDGRLRVCFDGRFVADRYPGVGRYSFELCRALAGTDEVELVILSHPGTTNQRFDLAGLETPRGSVEMIECRIDPRSFANHCFGASSVRRLHADLYHCPFFLSPFGDCGRKVISLHDLVPIRTPATISNPLLRWVFPLVLARTIRTADVILVPSQATARAVENWSRESSSQGVVIRIVPLAVRHDIFRPRSRAEVSSLRRRLNLPERYLLCVASPRPHKNVDLLERAWRQTDRGDTDLVILGTRNTRSTCTNGEAVHYLPPVREEDLPLLYSGAEICVVASDWEGFGLPVLEAMACGTAVVCSKGGALPEVAGDAALMFSTGDIGELVAAIETLLKSADRRREMGSAGREHAARFSWQQCAGDTISAYRESIQ